MKDVNLRQDIDSNHIRLNKLAHELHALMEYFDLEFYDRSDTPKLICRKKKKLWSRSLWS